MSTGKLRDLTEGEIADMLALLDSADRDLWVKMAMAVKSELGDGGFDVWDQWSRTDGKGYDASAAKAVWKSAKIGNITVGTLVFEAKRLGYVIDNGTSRSYHRSKSQSVRRHAKQFAKSRRPRSAQSRSAHATRLIIFGNCRSLATSIPICHVSTSRRTACASATGR